MACNQTVLHNGYPQWRGENLLQEMPHAGLTPKQGCFPSGADVLCRLAEENPCVAQARFLRVDVTLDGVAREAFVRHFHLPYATSHAQLDALMLGLFNFPREFCRLVITPQKAFFVQSAKIPLRSSKTFQYAVGCAWVFNVLVFSELGASNLICPQAVGHFPGDWFPDLKTFVARHALHQVGVRRRAFADSPAWEQYRSQKELTPDAVNERLGEFARAWAGARPIEDSAR